MMKKILDRLRQPPSFRVVRYANLAGAIIVLGLAIIADARGLAMLDCCLAGFNFATFVFTFYQERMRMHFDIMHAQFNAMAQLNNDLLAGGFDKLMQQADPEQHRPSLY